MSGRRIALLIANDEFNDPNFQQLKAPELDATMLETLLKNPDLCDFYVKTLINKTSYEINQAIEEFYSDSTRTDLLLLYFSGHGIKDEEGKLYFVTKDTRRNRLRSTAIPSSLINEGMRESRSRQQLLILDCCFSGAFAKGMIPKSGNVIGSLIGSTERFQGRGRVILTASDAMQYAFEEDDLIQGSGVNSLFSSAIINGLSTFGADANNDGIITVDELYDYVDEFVTERTPDQRPNIWAYAVQGEIVIAAKPPTVTETEVLVPRPEKSIRPISSESKAIPPVAAPSIERVSEVLSDQEIDGKNINVEESPSNIPTSLIRFFTILGGLCFVLYPVMSGQSIWANALPIVGAALLVIAFLFNLIGKNLDSR